MKLGGSGNAIDGSTLNQWKLRLQRFSDRFKLGSHYTMERFGVVMAALAITGVLFGTLATCGALQAGDAVLGQTALYTTQFTTSRTGVTGQVDPVYVSKDGHRALVLMKFDDPSMMSGSANDYEVYGTGIDGGPGGGPTGVDTAMAGTIYGFGSTGYLAVVLQAPDGFAPQLINLTIRANKELVAPKAAASQIGAGQDPTFAQHDQWRVIINPAATGARWLSALDGPNMPDAKTLYGGAVEFQQEQAKRRALDKEMAAMKASLTRISNLTAQMNQTVIPIGKDPAVRLLPPSLPSYVGGDSITGLSSADLRAKLDSVPANQIEGIANKTERARALDTFADNYTPNTYVLHSAGTMDGGVDFDWRSSSVADGYFKLLGKGDESLSDYLASLGNASPPSFDPQDLVWPLSNGQRVTDLSSTDAGAQALFELRSNLINAYQDYFNEKKSYQTVDLPDLLLMEQQLDTIGDSATTATGLNSVGFRS